MPLDYCLHDIGTPIAGEGLPAPALPASGGEKSLADNTDSADIVVAGPMVLAVVSTAKVRFELRPKGQAQDVANSKIVLGADQTRFFTLRRGTWLLRTLAYA